jgi:hypothetical protein
MPDDNLALVLNQDLAARTAAPEFAQLMQKISAYEVQSANVRVTNDAEYQMATDSLIAVAEVHKALEGMRKEIVSYPNTFRTTVNSMFKGLKERCEKARERLQYHATKYANAKEAEFAKQQAEVAAAAPEPSEAVDPDMVDAHPPQPPQPPMQSTKGTNGGSVSYREGRPEIEVVNAAKLVRAAVDPRNKVPVDVVQIDMSVLRKSVEGKLMTIKKWEKYGVKVTEKKDMVVRT